MKLPKKIRRGATLRLEFVCCGRCLKQHGSYWYAYWKDYRGVTRKQYIGRQLPDDVQPDAGSPPSTPAANVPTTTLQLDKGACLP
jgi:hypothetical protein